MGTFVPTGYTPEGQAEIDRLLAERPPLHTRLPLHLRVAIDSAIRLAATMEPVALNDTDHTRLADLVVELGHKIADELDARDLVIKPYLANAAFSIERVIARVRERSGAEPAQLDAEITTDRSSI